MANCPNNCMGGKIMYYDENGKVQWMDCPQCQGSGTVPD
ncbi:hypothetical protein SALB_03031 [Streptomyces noursei]|uniref:Uncharacterized protein n=1 Tax=Streptomyces noursei TaxID=1971 RepID=A0A401QY84_STRNR|nr:hypothetical protein SALB_03031 [Streptomyces noursei]